MRSRRTVAAQPTAPNPAASTSPGINSRTLFLDRGDRLGSGSLVDGADRRGARAAGKAHARPDGFARIEDVRGILEFALELDLGTEN